MKVRTVYFKVPDIKKASAFWFSVLHVSPHKSSDSWCEFMCGNIRLGLLLNDFGDGFSGSGCVPVFEFSDAEIPAMIARAQAAGAELLVDGLADQNMKSIVFRCPSGHEFEFSCFHD